MPTADKAIRRLTYELAAAKQLGYTAVKLIHGFGSSGVGGRLRIEVRNYLIRQKQRGMIRMFIAGETLSIFNAETRLALELCSELRADRDIERHNNGITIVLL